MSSHFCLAITENEGIMDYFDGMTDGKFKTDGQGRALFYPWGVLGKGYILPDQSKKQQIRKFVKLYCTFFWPVILAALIFTGWKFAVVVLFVMLFYYRLETSKFLEGVPSTDERLTLKESYANSARSHNLWSLWMIAIFSVLFLSSSIAILIRNKNAWIFGLVSVVFFGASAFVHGYMIKVKTVDLRRANQSLLVLFLTMNLLLHFLV
jgi:hypothetical protein